MANNENWLSKACQRLAFHQARLATIQKDRNQARQSARGSYGGAVAASESRTRSLHWCFRPNDTDRSAA